MSVMWEDFRLMNCFSGRFGSWIDVLRNNSWPDSPGHGMLGSVVRDKASGVLGLAWPGLPGHGMLASIMRAQGTGRAWLS